MQRLIDECHSLAEACRNFYENTNTDTRWPHGSRAKKAWNEIEKLRDRINDCLLPGLNTLLEVENDELLQDERDLVVHQLENGAEDLGNLNDSEQVRLINWCSVFGVLGTQMERIAVLLATRSERKQKESLSSERNMAHAAGVSRKREFHDLLRALFEGSPSHLRRFVKLADRGNVLELPGDIASFQELVDRVVGELCRFGHVPETLLRLREEFPNRIADIEQVQSAWT